MDKDFELSSAENQPITKTLRQPDVTEQKIKDKTKRRKMSIKADEAIKAVFVSDPALLARFVNSVFGTNYNPDNVKVEFLNADFIDESTFEEIIGDLIFKMDDDLYHFEFQTKNDKTMFIRMYGYGSAKVIERARTSSEEVLELEFPAPLVIYLEPNNTIKNIIDGKIKISGKYPICVDFKIPVLKLWDYSVESLVKNELYLLLPFYPIVYRKQAKNENLKYSVTGKVVATINQIVEELKKVPNNKGMANKIALFNALKEVTKNINQYLNNDDLKELISTMEVKGIRTYIDDLRDEAIFEGKAEGRAEGKAEGKAEGRAEGRAEGIGLATKIIQLYRQGLDVNKISTMLKLDVTSIDSIISLLK